MNRLLEIRIVPLLTCGGLASGPNGPVILIAEGLSRADAAETLWHEIIHLIKSANPKATHDEVEIELAATKLAETCPEVLGWCGWSGGK